MDLSLLLLSFIFPLLLDLISSLKWHYLSLAIKLDSPTLPLFAFYLTGRFFNLVLPSNIGGDIVRVHLQGKMTGQRALSAATVFMERYTGLLMLILMALLIGWLQSRIIDIPFLGTAMLVTIVVTVVIAWAIVDDRLFGFFHRLTVKLVPKLDIVFIKVNKFCSSVRLYRHAPASVAWSMVLSGLFYAVAIIYVWVAVSAFNPAVELYAMVIAVPLIMVMMNVPISIGSIGLMEFAYTVILGAMGIVPETALATALLIRLHTLFSAAIGGLLYAFRQNKSAEEPMQAPEEIVQKDLLL